MAEDVDLSAEYLNKVAERIRNHVPANRVPDGNAADLFRLYAVLLRAKGADVTRSDVHDAWSVWMQSRDSNHESLVPFEELSTSVQAQDWVFVSAIRRAASELDSPAGSALSFLEVLFPRGVPQTDGTTLELYKIMVASSEELVSRRQSVNTFFLTINGALLTASGFIVQNAGADRLTSWAIVVLGIAGVVLCLAWRSLITSFGQLNRGKFRVINTLEQHLDAAIYAAEWEALGRGQDPAVYRSFTSREIWVPNALFVLHGLTAAVALSVAIGWLSWPFGSPSETDNGPALTPSGGTGDVGAAGPP